MLYNSSCTIIIIVLFVVIAVDIFFRWRGVAIFASDKHRSMPDIREVPYRAHMLMVEL